MSDRFLGLLVGLVLVIASYGLSRGALQPTVQSREDIRGAIGRVEKTIRKHEVQFPIYEDLNQRVKLLEWEIRRLRTEIVEARLNDLRVH